MNFDHGNSTYVNYFYFLEVVTRPARLIREPVSDRREQQKKHRISEDPALRRLLRGPFKKLNS